MAKNDKGIQRYRVSCIGISPMLQNPATDAVLDDLLYGKGGRSKAVNKDKPADQIAAERVCKGPCGEFGFPSNYLSASLIEAGRHIVFDKKTKISTKDSSLLPSFLSIVDPDTGMLAEFIPFNDQKAGWVVDRRRGRLKNGASITTVCVVRPKFNIWAFSVTVEINTDRINIEKVRALFDEAGTSSGLGDFRPSTKGPFGRFKVVEFVELEQVADEERQAA